MRTGKIEIIISFLSKSRVRLHVLFWICIISGYVLVQPFLFFKYGWKVYLPFVSLKFLVVMLMVYINLYLLIPNTLVKKTTVLQYTVLLLVTNFIFSSMFSFLDTTLYQYLYKPGDQIRQLSDKIYYFITQFISNFWYLGATTALKFARKHFTDRMKLQAIEISNLQTEIKYLVAQINPHFLFNAINSIYVQIDRKNEAARETVNKFSDMLRYQLYDCNETVVSLDKEINYLENYVSIQMLRKSERHRINFVHPGKASNVMIPPMLFIGFLENAFKYVSNDKTRDNFIDIQLLLEGKKITFTSTNTKSSFTQPVNSTTSGIGLKNAKRRLELQFPDAHDLRITDNGDTFSITLILYLT